jgi:signal transduction histidine kinase
VLEQLRGEIAATPAGRVRLATVVQRAIEECGAQAPTPTRAARDDDVWVRADVEQFATVLAHVIRNAQDAAGPAGHVTVRTEATGSHAMIAIEDDGPGMDAEFIRNRLFKPFFTTKASKGMGIGAYQAREYVRSLGGALRVDSTLGRGTVFTLDVPLAAGEATAPVGAGINRGTAA